MGDCYFLSNYTKHRGELIGRDNRHDLVIRSEDLGNIVQGNLENFVKDRNMLQRIINGSYGIFFYESDLWDKEHLRKQLYKLIDEALAKYSAEPLY